MYIYILTIYNFHNVTMIKWLQSVLKSHNVEGKVYPHQKKNDNRGKPYTRDLLKTEIKPSQHYTFLLRKTSHLLKHFNILHKLANYPSNLAPLHHG